VFTILLAPQVYVPAGPVEQLLGLPLQVPLIAFLPPGPNGGSMTAAVTPTSERPITACVRAA
jgi:hypothetical protein